MNKPFQGGWCSEDEALLLRAGVGGLSFLAVDKFIWKKAFGLGKFKLVFNNVNSEV